MHLSRYPDSPHEDESITRLALFRLFASLAGRRLFAGLLVRDVGFSYCKEGLPPLQTTTPGQAFRRHPLFGLFHTPRSPLAGNMAGSAHPAGHAGSSRVQVATLPCGCSLVSAKPA